MQFFKSILNRAKNLYAWGLKENIFFMHIPKCGGTSISHAISRKYLTPDFTRNRIVSLDTYASSNTAKLLDLQTLKFRENLLLYFMNMKNVKYISGHFSFSEIAFREFHNKFAFVTVLREPVKRWISVYFYSRYKESTHCKIETDITTFIQSKEGKSKGHAYIRFLGGIDEEMDYTSKQALDRAKGNLDKFDIVGFLEYKENFIQQFENRFGVRLALKKENPSPVTQIFKDSVITEEIIEKIKTICKPDIEIYQYAVDKFVKRNH
ncbi:MAG: hypothetical protein E3K38_13805 [Candidatus Kuenenia stuttgartiensis]|nr:hypothetical protein [Candidatus Kuenenia stuttgartiensis]